jgi:2-polyprenyl-3-methyl-5-hydroxy-6-metoxy-1,4-benzoquinol methylase
LKEQLQEYGNIQSSVSYFMRFDIGKNLRILDIGTRFGTFINELYKLGHHNVFGIDIDEWAIEKGKGIYPHLAPGLHTYDGQRIPFDKNTFDVVTAFDVLEHIPDLPGYLFEVYRVIKEGGVLLFQTPNKYINIPWSIIFARTLNYAKFHCSLQSKTSLYRILKNAGFGNIIVEKYPIKTAHNILKIRKVFGRMGPLLIDIFERVPLSMYPNFWGHCYKCSEPQ